MLANRRGTYLKEVLIQGGGGEGTLIQGFTVFNLANIGGHLTSILVGCQSTLGQKPTDVLVEC